MAHLTNKIALVTGARADWPRGGTLARPRRGTCPGALWPRPRRSRIIGVRNPRRGRLRRGHCR